jgi:hypothetical protein
VISRAQQTVGFFAAVVFLVGVVAATAMQASGTTTASAKSGTLSDDVGKTTDTHSAKFVIKITVASPSPYPGVSGSEDFAHHAIDFVGPGGVEVARVIGGVTYLYLPHALPSGKTWVVTHGTRIDDPVAVLKSLSVAKSAKSVGHTKLDGVSVTEYAVTFDLKSVMTYLDRTLSVTTASSPLVSGVAGSVWVDDSRRIHRFELTLTVRSVSLVIDVRMSDFGKRVSIAVPPADQTIDATAVPGLGLTQSKPG